MSERTPPQPIFVMGAPRSGTTLLAAMLNAHSRLSCGNETHFFEGLRDGAAEYLTDPRHWPRRACAYASRLRHIGRSIFELYQVDFADYSKALESIRPSVAAALRCFMECYLTRTGKRRWVEKTPGHLKWFTRIRAHFPTSPVICIVRDPRDVALSLMGPAWGTKNLVDGLLIWKTYFKYYQRFVLSDKNVLTIKFEDLVQDPPEVCERICLFVGESFEPGMLDTSLSAVGVGSCLEPYKENAARPVDSGRAFAWRRELREHDLCIADSLLNRDLHWLGYSSSGASRSAMDPGRMEGIAGRLRELSR
jgi:Sulfotransferase family